MHAYHAPSATALKSPQHWGAGHPSQRVGGPSPSRLSTRRTSHKAILGEEKKKSKMTKQTYFPLHSRQPPLDRVARGSRARRDPELAIDRA
jgi:hypothetical protein